MKWWLIFYSDVRQLNKVKAQVSEQVKDKLAGPIQTIDKTFKWFKEQLILQMLDKEGKD